MYLFENTRINAMIHNMFQSDFSFLDRLTPKFWINWTYVWSNWKIEIRRTYSVGLILLKPDLMPARDSTHTKHAEPFECINYR